MNKILKRDEYINEVYIPMMEEKQYEELQMVNEGLLKNLFGIVKNMFKRDWATIKGDPQIIAAYKEMDDNLTGFSIMKLKKKEECNQVRQALVDFACDWYDMKMNKAKESGNDPVPAKSMNFKNETLKENMDTCEKKIREIVKDDEQMKKWAETLLDDMKTVINRSILEDIKDEELKAELEKQYQEDIKKQAKQQKVLDEWNQEQLKEIKKERDQFITEAGADPKFIKEDLLGDRAVKLLCAEFDKFKKVSTNTEEKTEKKTEENSKLEKRINLMKNDTVFGFKKLFTDDDYNAVDNYKMTFKLMNSFYTSLGTNEIMEKFKETPGQSVQAMCIAINSFIKNCVYGGSDYSEELPLMAKCAVISDGLVSYNLPLNDKEGDDAGNYFTDIVGIITRGELTYPQNYGTNSGKKIKLPKDFDVNAKTLFNKIKSEAETLKKKAEDNYNKHLKKLNLD